MTESFLPIDLQVYFRVSHCSKNFEQINVTDEFYERLKSFLWTAGSFWVEKSGL